MSDGRRLASPAWDLIAGELPGRTSLVVGAPGSGKSRFCLALAQALAGDGHAVALVSLDPGQPLVGVPGCLGLARLPPWDRPAALWFVGDTSPAGNLLPTTVGAGVLARRARELGAGTLLVDTCGMVEGPLSRILEYHQMVATLADQMVAIGRDEATLSQARLFETTGGRVLRLDPVDVAHDRNPDVRRAWRQARYAEHWSGAGSHDFPRSRILGSDWMALDDPGTSDPPAGAVYGLLDADRLCLGMGLVESAGATHVRFLTSVTDISRVVFLQAGRIQLDPARSFEELRARSV